MNYMYKIILDTNFLMMPYINNVDIFREILRICNFPYEICVLDKTIDELNHIKDVQRGKFRKAANIALSLIKFKNIKIIKTQSDNIVDNIIVGLINSDEDYIVATQDKELLNRLGKKPKIYLRQKKYLKLEM